MTFASELVVGNLSARGIAPDCGCRQVTHHVPGRSLVEICKEMAAQHASGLVHKHDKQANWKISNIYDDLP